MRIIFSNVDIFSTDKISELKTRIKMMENCPHIVALQEVKPKHFRFEREIVEYNIEGYEVLEKNLKSDEEGRGLIIYIKEGLSYGIVTLKEKYCEYLCVEVKGKSERVVVASIYRSPSSDDENNKKLLGLLQEISDLSVEHKVVCGDFNLPGINWQNYTLKSGADLLCFDFIEKIRDCYFVQHVQEITRFRGESTGTMLDLIFSNDVFLIEDIEVNSPLGKSDHACVSFNCDLKPQQKKRKKTVFMYEKADWKKMRDKLSINWKELLIPENVESVWEKFKSKLAEAIKECIPRKEFVEKQGTDAANRRRKRDLPINRRLWSKIKRKQRLWERLKKIKNGQLECFAGEYLKVQEEYRRTNNQVRRDTRKEIKNLEMKIAKNVKENPKIFWKYVQSKTKNAASIPELYADKDKKVKTNGDKEKAEVLSEVYSNVFTREPVENVPVVEKRNVPAGFPVEFREDVIIKVIDKLKRNKSPGPDGLHPRIIKEMKDQLVVPLKILFECSFNRRHVPEEWRYANISAIFKKGDRSEPSNYRPVSLTCIICKIMESIIRESMIRHMKKHRMFSKKQFGFISGRSTVLQLLKVLDRWTETMDEGHAIDVAYCDFMKAFDKVPHRRLMEKVKSYNFGDGYVEWITMFLSGRKQRVVVNGEESECREVLSGVPQGSVLGPLLFVVYINDLPDVLENNSEVYLYADDTKIFRRIEEQEDCRKLQDDIRALKTWSEKWLLKFHPSKCKVMRIGRSEVPEEHYVMDEIMESVVAEKDLGVIIDSDLSFEKHASEKINKANSIVGLIRRTFVSLDEVIFRSLFTALIRPILEYANQVWCPYKIKDITAIENVQRRATRLVPSLRDLSYSDRLKKLNLPTLAYRRSRGDMIETYKILQGVYDDDVCGDLFVLQGDSRTRGHSKKLFKRRTRLNIRKYCFCNRVVDNWNSLPEWVVNVDSVDKFERELDKVWYYQSQKFEFREKINLKVSTKSTRPTNIDRDALSRV